MIFDYLGLIELLSVVVMLPTIPFKRHRPKSHKHQVTVEHPKPVSAHVNKPKSHIGKPKSSIFAGKRRLLLVSGFIVLIAIAGIAIIRFSLASSSGSSTVPTNLSEIQNYISTLSKPSSSKSSSILAKSVDFYYTPTDASSTKAVAYYLDGQLVEASTKPPYNYVLETNRYPNGLHTLSVVAFNINSVPIAVITQKYTFKNPSNLLQDIQNTLTYPYYRMLQL